MNVSWKSLKSLRKLKTIEKIDNQTYSVFLSIPGDQVVLLQAYFELYEGLGTVRTLDINSSKVCVLTTKSQLITCLKAIDSLKESLSIKFDKKGSFDAFNSFSKKRNLQKN